MELKANLDCLIKSYDHTLRCLSTTRERTLLWVNRSRELWLVTMRFNVMSVKVPEWLLVVWKLADSVRQINVVSEFGWNLLRIAASETVGNVLVQSCLRWVFSFDAV